MWRYPAVFALLMIAFALFAPPYASVQHTQPDQHRAAYPWQPANPASFVQQAVEPSLYKQPCQGTADDRQSDLCAQWESVDWTKIGTIVGIFGTIALLIQIRLGWMAVEDTGEATARMKEANRIARDTAHIQLRAYVSVHPLDFVRNQQKVEVRVRLSNGGNTPARNVRFYTSGAVQVPEATPEIVSYVRDNPSFSDDSSIVLVAGQQIGRTFNVAITKEQEDVCRAGTVWFYFAGRVEYADVFDQTHTTWFCHAFYGAEMTPITYRHGNGAD